MESQLFTNHSNPKLTFIIGTVAGITLMTLLEVAFISYAVSGGTMGGYSVGPLEASPQLLGDVKQSVKSTTAEIAVPTTMGSVVGDKTDYAVTLVEYVDFECRFCKKFFPEVQQFVTDHQDQVRLIIKHYPLTQMHPQAQAAAVAASCAAEQGQLVTYAAELFNFQTNLGTATYLDLAKTIGLNENAFTTCLANPAVTEQVSADSAEAEALGIRSQPALVIWHNDGKLETIDGYVNRDYLESALQEYLR